MQAGPADVQDKLKDRLRIATRYDRCLIGFFTAIALEATVALWI